VTRAGSWLTMIRKCPECGQEFYFVWESGAETLAHIFSVNPDLKIICTRCGRLQMLRQCKRVDFREDVRAVVAYNGFMCWPEAREFVA